MADFDLTQTDQQVQNILNDAQGAMGASAQTTLTTEYVMLKDTNGVYHKILKSSFTEAIRDVLAGLLVNNDKGTTINQIAAIASGDFGSITPANLASVLGGVTIGINANQDFNDFTTPGVLYYAASGSISTSLSHRPSGLIESFMMMYFRNNPGQTQILVTTWSAFKLYKRSYDNGWQKWQLVTGTAVEYAE